METKVVWQDGKKTQARVFFINLFILQRTDRKKGWKKPLKKEAAGQGEQETGTSQTGTEGNGQQEQTEGNEKREAGCAP